MQVEIAILKQYMQSFTFPMQLPASSLLVPPMRSGGGFPASRSLVRRPVREPACKYFSRVSHRFNVAVPLLVIESSIWACRGIQELSVIGSWCLRDYIFDPILVTETFELTLRLIACLHILG
jgi:hypothetical protein